jgi:hypothetical protein
MLALKNAGLQYFLLKRKRRYRSSLSGEVLGFSVSRRLVEYRATSHNDHRLRHRLASHPEFLQSIQNA